MIYSDWYIIKIVSVMESNKNDIVPITIDHVDNYEKSYEKYCVIRITILAFS